MQQQDLGQFPYREFIWGIGGTARYAKIAGHTAQNFYVDSTHANAHADNDGTDPEAPFALIQSAVDSPFLTARSTIFVSGASTESVTVPTTIADYVNLVAVGQGLGGGQPVLWAPAAGDGLTIDAYGWYVYGFRFQPAADGAGVKLTRVSGAGAEGTVIQRCFFDGLWGQGLYGVELDGAPANVSILNCRFAEFDASSPCITLTATGTASPYQTHILDCTFQECAEYLTSVVGGWNASVIMRNVFAEATGDLAATTTYIDLGTGSLGYNIVTQNIFSGDYSNTGGYTAESQGLDNWVGNYAADVAEAEVGDNGLTIAEPAA